MIYLDSAATTLQKPSSVKYALQRAVDEMSTPGRGNYSAAREAAETAFRCRSEAAELFGVSSPENVIFTMNATHALNIAIKSLVQPGGRAVISGYEHNAVTRPLAAIGNVEIATAYSPLFDPSSAEAAFARALDRKTDVVVCTHVSNVFGYVLPIEAIARMCAYRGIPLIVDASQSAGVLAVDVSRWGAAFVAMPGHKGLYGPQGTGLLLCAHEAKPLLEGGTGSASIEQTMPEFYPDRLEAGTHNMPGIAGLLAGIRFVRGQKLPTILSHEQRLCRQIISGLQKIPGIHTFAGDDTCRTGVVSFVAAGQDAEDIAQALSERGIAVRGGLHCAPLAHRSAGTLEGGTVRVSPSIFNTGGEAERFLWELRHIVHRKATF